MKASFLAAALPILLLYPFAASAQVMAAGVMESQGRSAGRKRVRLGMGRILLERDLRFVLLLDS
jgi:hypothetical protein